MMETLPTNVVHFVKRTREDVTCGLKEKYREKIQMATLMTYILTRKQFSEHFDFLLEFSEHCVLGVLVDSVTSQTENGKGVPKTTSRRSECFSRGWHIEEWRAIRRNCKLQARCWPPGMHWYLEMQKHIYAYHQSFRVPSK